jgi:hypothetical protein
LSLSALPRLKETEKRCPIEFRISPVEIHVFRPVEDHQAGVRLDAMVHGGHFVEMGVTCGDRKEEVAWIRPLLRMVLASKG